MVLHIFGGEVPGGNATTLWDSPIVGLFADPNYTEFEVTWGVYQDIVNAYRNDDKGEGQRLLQAVIDALSSGLPTGFVELKRLGRTFKRRAADVLAFFTRPGTSNGPTESVECRVRHSRASVGPLLVPDRSK
ncbi:transposase [Brevibacterium aurantiacum]|uniref:transposase n=1 Tax=Brevibacterium aurantiacum TaxID=273384 RepID=UPI00387E6619